MFHRSRTPVIGLILIAIGVLLFLHQWHRIHFDWTTILMLIGALLFVAGVFQRDRGAVLPGTFLFLLGLVFYLDKYEFMLFAWWERWPVVLLCLGIAFLVHFIFNPSRKGALIPGIILIIIGLLFLYAPFCWYDLFNWTAKLWPILLILLGIYLIVKSLKRNREHGNQQ
jgi:uncharacterized membrane protein HdeD (DUF308 family)